MLAILKKNKELENFQHGKEYYYTDEYNIANASLRFCVRNDNNKTVNMTERMFTTYFYGGVPGVAKKYIDYE